MTVDELRDALDGVPGNVLVTLGCEHDGSSSYAHVLSFVTVEQVEHNGVFDDIVIAYGSVEQLFDRWEDLA